MVGPPSAGTTGGPWEEGGSQPTPPPPRALLEGEGAIGAVLERLQSGHRGCESGWGGRLLAVGNAVGAGVGVWECLWGRVSAVGRGEGVTPPPFQAIPCPPPIHPAGGGGGGGLPSRPPCTRCLPHGPSTCRCPAVCYDHLRLHDGGALHTASVRARTIELLLKIEGAAPELGPPVLVLQPQAVGPIPSRGFGLALGRTHASVEAQDARTYQYRGDSPADGGAPSAALPPTPPPPPPCVT